MRDEMQAPILVFDHIRHIVATIPTGAAADRRLTELLESQRKQVATSGRPAK